MTPKPHYPGDLTDCHLIQEHLRELIQQVHVVLQPRGSHCMTPPRDGLQHFWHSDKLMFLITK